MFFLFLLIGQLSFAQNATLVQVPGTKCSLIPPKDFVPASNFAGFQNAVIGASIMINELPAAYTTLIKGFTKDALQSKGMNLVSNQSIDFSQGKATLMQVTQEARGVVYIKQMLIFGDDKTSIIVNGIYPQSSKDIAAEMQKALLSIVYNSKQSDDPLAAVSFTIDTRGSNYIVTKFMSGGLLYTVDGKIPTEKPILIVTPSLATIPADRQKTYAEGRIKAMPGGESTTIKTVNEISIDDMNGYEIIANGKTKAGGRELIYQVMIFDEKGNYYLIVGQAAEDFDNNLDIYKKLAKTFKRKKTG